MVSAALIHVARKGDQVVAEDGPLGQVDSIVRSESGGPSYVVVSAGSMLRRRYPVLHCALVTRVDRSSARLYVRGQRGSLACLSESVPIVI
jgi:hypothetical protein